LNDLTYQKIDGFLEFHKEKKLWSNDKNKMTSHFLFNDAAEKEVMIFR